MSYICLGFIGFALSRPFCPPQSSPISFLLFQRLIDQGLATFPRLEATFTLSYRLGRKVITDGKSIETQLTKLRPIRRIHSSFSVFNE
jgi:hypothetical protein